MFEIFFFIKLCNRSSAIMLKGGIILQTAGSRVRRALQQGSEAVHDGEDTWPLQSPGDELKLI